MSKKIYVGNLSFNTNEDAIKDLFSKHGEVNSVKIITDSSTGRSRGFGFIEMEGADEAITKLNGTPFEGRPLKVNEAHERKQRQYGFRRDNGGYGSNGSRYRTGKRTGEIYDNN